MADLKSIGVEEPLVDISPNVVVSGKSIRYEFKCMKDLNRCCKNKTFVFVKEDQKEDSESEPNLLGKYSNRGVGQVFIGLHRKDLQIQIIPGQMKESLSYNLLQPGAKDYEARKATDDTQEDLEEMMGYLFPLLHSICRSKYPDPRITLSNHIPNFLKLKMPTNEAEKANEVPNTYNSYNLMEHLKQSGLVMVKLLKCNFIDIRGLSCKLVGVTFTFHRLMYRTDAEKAALVKQREADRKIRLAQEAGKAKREEAQEKKVGGVKRPASALDPLRIGVDGEEQEVETSVEDGEGGTD